MAKREGGYLDLKKFATRLRELTEGLPTGTEKAEIRKQFEEIIAFLNQAQRALDGLPTREETDGVRRAVEAFDELAIRAKASPFVAAAIGLVQPRTPRPKAAPLSAEENTRAQALLTQLQSLSIDEMRNHLSNNESVSSREVNAIAALVGIKATRRTSRDELAHQVATKISNFRGYQDLKGGAQTTEGKSDAEE
jgi:DNA primase